MSNHIVEEIWKRHREWSAAAGDIKSSIAKWRRIILILTVAGAFFATLSTQIPPDTVKNVIAWISAAFLAIIPIITPRKLSSEQIKAWTRARSASEGLKMEVYTYLAKAAPYDGESNTAIETLRKRAREIEDAVSNLAKYVATAKPYMTSPPELLSPNDYIQLRVTNQIDWYRSKAGLYKGRSEKLRAIELVLAVAAALLAAASGVWGETLSISSQTLEFGVWVAVLTTIGGTLTSHIAASRYDHFVTSYSATASQLRNLVLTWPPADGGKVPSTEWSEFVRQCEDAISKENESWIAKWSKEEG